MVLDEADFRASDERAEIVKILNNGHAVGFSVLRSDVTPSKEFRPRAFRIFGPKIIATRHSFENEALESRCLTAVLGARPLRGSIPISLTEDVDREALQLRNKLLMYRFRRQGAQHSGAEMISGVSPRLSQILLPLLSVATCPHARARMIGFATGQQRRSATQTDLERVVVEALCKLCDRERTPVTLKSLCDEFLRRTEGLYGRDIQPRFIGGILRRLGVPLHKTGGIFVVPAIAMPKVCALRELYRFAERDEREEGDEDKSVAPVV